MNHNYDAAHNNQQVSLEFQMVLVFLATAMVLALTFVQFNLAADYQNFIDALSAYVR